MLTTDISEYPATITIETLTTIKGRLKIMARKNEYFGMTLDAFLTPTVTPVLPRINNKGLALS